MSNMESLKIKPYARLITMLGDQLIKDESIAIIELVKNAYDADAENVTISFQGFNASLSASSASSIIIEDDGNGMDDYILKSAWMNPATPEKLIRKREKSTTDKGRIMQGEKGIGRFAIFKLGRTIDIITRRQKHNGLHFVEKPASEIEYVLHYDFSNYDADFLKEGDEEKEIFLDDLSATLEERLPVTFVQSRTVIDENNGKIRKPYGTKIIISHLNGTWNKSKINKVNQNLLRMQPIFGDEFQRDFSVHIVVNGETYLSHEQGLEKIRTILNQKSVFIVSGSFNNTDNTIQYKIESKDETRNLSFTLSDPEMLGLSEMKSFFDAIKERAIECGSFSYKFFIFDLDIAANKGDTRYYLTEEEKKSIKAHRVYLYRDGIRVMPYGDQEDDWLKLDVIRGTERANKILGNDQLVGYITITQQGNPNLKDKTNREGLIEDGNAKYDLVSICQLILRYIRTNDYSKYVIDKKRRIQKANEELNKPMTLIANARKEDIGKQVLDKVLKGNKNVKPSDIPPESINEGQKYVNRILDTLEQAYRKEVDVMETRITRTENLAAIGLSAETAYHDARIILQEANNALGALINYYKKASEFLMKNQVVKDLSPIKKQTSTAAALMQDIQRLFPSTSNKKKQVNIHYVITMVRNLYAKSLQESNVTCAISSTGNELIMECTDAVLLQVFINLFDNALYWLKTIKWKREIRIIISTDDRTVIFSDSGPGVKENDAPYIFEPFFSGKGEDGKGLGLYIARQLLDRYNSSIELIQCTEDKILSGANFLLKLGNEVS